MRFLVICLIFYYLRDVTPAGSPNFILLLTDDQDILLNSLEPMQKTIELLANNGVVFKNAFVNTPICCPSRSSLLTGKFAHNTRVVNNSISGNCSSRYWQENFEQNSIASLLKNNKNYTTFYAGKYLNQYGSKGAGGIEHVPLFYDWWIGLKGNSKYYNYTLSINGTGKYFKNKYLTDLIGSYALDFLRLNHKKPFFMTIAPPAPHAPFTAADRHLDKFPTVKAVRTPSFNYSSEEKHWIVQMPPKSMPSNISRLDVIQKKRFQTLLAVDEMVEKLVKELKKLSVYENTYIIFTSDNGYHIGQFGQPWDKRQPYETDIRVPFIISGPNIPRKEKLSYPISSVDIAPTILDLAGVPSIEDMDGHSFKKELRGTKREDFEKFILVEYWGEGNENKNDKDCFWRTNQLTECTKDSWCKCQDSKNNTYACVIYLTNEKQFKVCHFFDDSNFFEAYNLVNDPFELHNLYWENSTGSEFSYYTKILTFLQHCEGYSCRSVESHGKQYNVKLY